MTSEGKVEVSSLIGRMTLDIIGSVAFGVDIGSISNPELTWTDKVNKKIFSSWTIFGGQKFSIL